MKKAKLDTVRVAMMLDRNQIIELRHRAIDEHKSVSDIMRRLVAQYLEAGKISTTQPAVDHPAVSRTRPRKERNSASEESAML